jgi:hypothetical protein
MIISNIISSVRNKRETTYLRSIIYVNYVGSIDVKMLRNQLCAKLYGMTLVHSLLGISFIDRPCQDKRVGLVMKCILSTLKMLRK